jgi:pantothenate synthetase
LKLPGGKSYYCLQHICKSHQFNNSTDFEKYPVTIESDIDKLEASGCDVLFLPPVDEIYPPDLNRWFMNSGTWKQ